MIVEKFKIVIISMVLLNFLVACSTTSTSNSAMAPRLSQKTAQANRLLIRSAQLEIEVEEPEITVKKIEGIVNRDFGYIDSIYDRNQTRISMVVKIPVKKLDLFVEDVSSLGKLISKSLSTRDVTEEMIDVEARLTNLRALRDRFRKLLDKSQNITDTLKIEAELTRIQTQIDVISGRKKILKNQTALSRVDITITQETVYGPLGYLGKGFYWVFKKLFVIR